MDPKEIIKTLLGLVGDGTKVFDEDDNEPIVICPYCYKLTPTAVELPIETYHKTDCPWLGAIKPALDYIKEN